MDQSEVSVAQTERLIPPELPVNVAVRLEAGQTVRRMDGGESDGVGQHSSRPSLQIQLVVRKELGAVFFTCTVFSLWSHERCHVTAKEQRLALHRPKALDTQIPTEKGQTGAHFTLTLPVMESTPSTQPTDPSLKGRRYASGGLGYLCFTVKLLHGMSANDTLGHTLSINRATHAS